MAMTLRASIALYDGMTSPLRHMTSAMNTLLSGFERMQDASKNAVDVSSLKYARTELAKAETAFDGIEQSIREADERQKKFNQSIKAGTNASNGLWGKIKGIAGAYIGTQAVTGVIQLSDQFTNTNARLNNAQLMFDDGGSLQELEKKVMASAQRSRTSYVDAASAIAKLGQNASDAFGSMDEVIAFQELINKSFVVGGASVQEQQNAMIQLTQAMASGVLRGEELNSVFEQAPRITQSIADYLDVPLGKIREMAAEGQITADVVKNAMFAAADDIENTFSNMPMTWAQIWTSMQNKALSIFAPILTKLNQIANSEKFTQVTDGIINSLAGIASVATGVFDLMINFASVIVDNWSWIAPVILGVAAALGVYYGWLLLAKGAELASAAATGALTLAKMIAVPVYAALTGATMAETASQWGLNAAMYACPLVWIIILIIALIALFYGAVAAINHFAGTSVSATGIICGAFMAALAFIGNIFIAMWNYAVDVFVAIYNLVASVANFIGNVFNDPIGAICRLFFDLADTVLSVLQALASAIDTIFGSNLASSVQGWRDSLGGWVDTTFGKGEEVMAKMNADDLRLGRFEYDAAFDMGYNFGKGIDNSMGSLFDFSGMDSLGASGGDNAYNLENAIKDSGLGGSSGDTADNTARMADALDITDEELEYLRDIAEREAVNRFTTAEIQVNFGGINNNVSSNMDLDGIVNYIGEGVYEAMEVAAEGV